MKKQKTKKDNFDAMLAETFSAKTSNKNLVDNPKRKENHKKESDKKNLSNQKSVTKNENKKNFQQVKKTTVSFYPTEHEIIDKILGRLHKERGARGGFSDAVKISLRLCPLDSYKIANAWDRARAEDGRVKRHKKK